MSKPLKGPAAYSDAWYALRYFEPERPVPVIIGASESAAACGISQYDTPLHVYLRKRRLLSDKEQTDRMRNGKLFEPIIVEIYRLQSGFKVQPAEGMLLSGENHCIAATPDADVWEPNGTRFCMDAKMSSVRMEHKWGEDGSDEIPDDYLLQGQQQMYVGDVDRCDFALLMDGLVRHFTVRRNEKLIKHMLGSLNELVERIVEGNPPNPDFRHPATKKLLEELNGVNPDSRVELTDELHRRWEESRAMAAQITQLQKEQTAIKNEILYAMGDAAIGVLPSDPTKVLTRKVVERDEYTVKPSSYKLLSEKKVTEKKGKK